MTEVSSPRSRRGRCRLIREACSYVRRRGWKDWKGLEGEPHARAITLPAHPALPARQGSLALRRVHLDRVAVGHATDRVVWPCDDLITRLEPGGDLEVFVPGDADLDPHEFHLVVGAERKHA